MTLRIDPSRRRPLRYAEEPDPRADQMPENVRKCLALSRFGPIQQNEPTDASKCPGMPHFAPSNSKCAKRTHHVKIAFMRPPSARPILLLLLIVATGCSTLRSVVPNQKTSTGPRADRIISAG